MLCIRISTVILSVFLYSLTSAVAFLLMSYSEVLGEILVSSQTSLIGLLGKYSTWNSIPCMFHICFTWKRLLHEFLNVKLYRGFYPLVLCWIFSVSDQAWKELMNVRWIHDIFENATFETYNDLMSDFVLNLLRIRYLTEEPPQWSELHLSLENSEFNFRYNRLSCVSNCCDLCWSKYFLSQAIQIYDV